MRDRFKIIPECVRETDLHPDPPAAALRTLNFPRAALGHDEEEEELTLPELSLFFFSPGVISLLCSHRKKKARPGSRDSPRLLFLDT